MADPAAAISIGAELWGILKWVVAGAVGLLAWLWKRQTSRVDRLEEAHNRLASQVITKDDLTNMRQDIAAGLERVAGEIRHQSGRIDGLYKDGRD